MSDPAFAQFYPQSAAFEPQAYHSKLDPAAHPTIALDGTENQKPSFDFFSYSQPGLDVVAPHPDQFELELDNSLAAFDAELSLIPIDATDFTFYRGETPTFGPPSTFTVSSESVSGYDSAYNDNISSRSESFYNFNAQSPTSNYTSSVYSLTQEQLDMEFQRMAMPTHDDPNSFGALPASPSIRSSPGSVPNISHYSPPYSSPRGSFSDYEPAQPQQVRLGSSAASDYYPSAHVQLNKYGPRVVQAQAPQARSTASVSPQLAAMSHPSAVSHPSLTAQRAKIETMHDDPKRKYQCPTCPRAFARAYNLKTHIQTHDPNRLKPYACHHKSCGRSFSRKHDLTRHMVSIHRAESVTALQAATAASSPRAIGVDSGRRAWCEQCGRGWVGKGKEKGCECNDVK
ncbi:transcription factor [Ganoderma sinense ZZ0214-1]|uniref:Transcription factor n=1 Tax=Ganoderma sinense ZZ0214-1 TaxID=1077348 RepID=A0A2G8S7E0_9APHY|nr:transcription factor [Ganoderma sinense ZZ0214-1]